jgi:hypothetical protein
MTPLSSSDRQPVTVYYVVQWTGRRHKRLSGPYLWVEAAGQVTPTARRTAPTSSPEEARPEPAVTPPAPQSPAPPPTPATDWVQTSFA